MDSPEFHDVATVAKRLGFSEQTVRKMCRRKQLASVSTGGIRPTYRISDQAVLELEQKQSTAAQPATKPRRNKSRKVVQQTGRKSY